MFEVIINPDNKIFWEGCKNKKLLLQKCKNCGNIIWPFSFACNKCYSNDIKIIESTGKGKIYSYTVFNVPFHKDFKDKVPYVVAIIELNEGIKFLSNIVSESLEYINCESEVKIFWEKRGEYYIPLFKII